MFAPYWFLVEDDGEDILEDALRAEETVGLHVPADVPAEPGRRDRELRDLNLFVRPGEIRSVGVAR